MTSTSEMSNTYSRQVLRAGDIFRWKEAGEIPSSDESTQVQPVNGQRENVSKRRVIHIDYADIFGEMVLPELRQAGPKGSHANILPVPQPQVAPPPSPVYEQTIHGLTVSKQRCLWPKFERNLVPRGVVCSAGGVFEILSPEEKRMLPSHSKNYQKPGSRVRKTGWWCPSRH